MQPRSLAYIAVLLLLSACEPNRPEPPSEPPLPTALSHAADMDEPRPTLTAQIDAGGRRTRYSAYFEGAALARIEESAADGTGSAAEYRFSGARLMKYSRASSGGDAMLLELDDRGRVQRALGGTRELTPSEIDSIRTHAQLLRSHALAQHASKLHVH